LVVAAGLLWVGNLVAQTGSSELRQILERLEGLERSNRQLTEEVRALRSELAAANSRTPSENIGAPEQLAAQEEQLAVQKERIEEQAQTKVESGQRFPIRIKGMLLFNTFLNSKQGGGERYPTVAVNRGDASGGATLRQSVIGFDYQGPEVFAGGKVRASLLMDFYGASGQSLDQALRIRTANMEIDWKSRSLSLGVNKPLFSPRDPDSLSQVNVSPLTSAGNLWMWIPQLRFEQRLRWSDLSQVRAQIALVQTREIPSYNAGDFVAKVEPARPGVEGRLEFSHAFGAGRRIEIAPGFHFSTSHVAQTPVPSRLFSMDWLLSPGRRLEFTGAFFNGRNIAHLGNGGIGEGFAVLGPQQVMPLHSSGEWGQLTWMATDRLSFHLFSGRQDERNRILPPGEIGINLAYGANLFYHLAPNVIVSLETSQVRTSYIQQGRRLNNHYDLAFAYIF
jgi:hypothetical protein